MQLVKYQARDIESVLGSNLRRQHLIVPAVAVIDDAITLKRYYKEAGRIRLQPENPDFQAIYCTDVRIVGILANIVRTY